MRVIVTGGRKRTDKQRVWDELSALLEEHGPFVLVHGACPIGADLFAHQWAETHTIHEVTEVRYPAHWLKDDGSVDKSAGFRRNAEMVAKGADMCLAFPHPTGNGTQHTMDLCRKAGIYVKEIPEEG